MPNKRNHAEQFSAALKTVRVLQVLYPNRTSESEFIEIGTMR